MAISTDSNLQPFEAEAPVTEIAVVRACRTCHYDLTTLPIASKYCPQCGIEQVNETAGSAPAGPEARRKTGDAGNPADGGSAIVRRRGRSPLLRGFASAMYRLGVRYDGGLGIARNPDEAQRCYYKAAKLGDGTAIARLNASAQPPDGTSSAHTEAE